IGLGAATAVDRVGSTVRHGGSHTWVPASVDAIQPEYSVRLGNGVLDLRQVELAERSVDITVNVQWSRMTVYVPPNADVDVKLTVNDGDANILGTNYQGNSVTTVSNRGLDNKEGGGKVTITLRVEYGYAEVIR